MMGEATACSLEESASLTELGEDVATIEQYPNHKSQSI